MENLNAIHLLSDEELIALVKQSDELNAQDADGAFDAKEGILTITHARQRRDPHFRKKVYDAYKNKCAMCGISLELVEAAHIVPHSHVSGTRTR